MPAALLHGLAAPCLLKYNAGGSSAGLGALQQPQGALQHACYACGSTRKRMSFEEYLFDFGLKT